MTPTPPPGAPPTSSPLRARLAPFLAKHLERLADVPADLAPYVHTADASAEADAQSPWWLAERIVVSALEDPALEADVTALLGLVREALRADAGVLPRIFDIADRLFDVVAAVLAAPRLKNLFTEANALVTVYFTIVFVACCALGGRDEDGDGVDDAEAAVAAIRAHEGVWVRLARLATKLLLNRQVYEFVAEARDRTCACAARLLPWI